MTRIPAIVIVVALLAGTAAYAQAPADRAANAARTAARIRMLQQEADRLAGASRTLLGDLRRLELEQQIGREKLRAAEADLETVTESLATARGRVKQLEAQRVQATPALAAELVEIYKRGRRRHAQLLLTRAADSRALGRLVRGIAAIGSAERLQIDRHRRALRAERDAVSELEQRAAAAADATAAQVAAQADLERTVAARNRLIDTIDGQRDVAARYAGELQAAQVALERTLAGLGPMLDAASALPIAPFKGDLDWPVRGTLRSRFASADRSSPGRSAPAIVRNGIEVIATEGTSVTAVHDGRVSYAAPFIGLGTLVVVDHGRGVQTLYGHLSDISVDVGASVGRGERLGVAGPAGGPGLRTADGPALSGAAGLALSGVEGLAPTGAAVVYFELRVDGRPVDPLQWLRSSP